MPSLTELVVALGLGERLVARTGFCIHPAEALARVPKVGGTKDVNLAKLRRLAPTHVLVNVDENRRETVEAIARLGRAPRRRSSSPIRSGRRTTWRWSTQLAAAFARRARRRRPRRRACRRRWPRELAATRAGRPPGAAACST